MTTPEAAFQEDDTRIEAFEDMWPSLQSRNSITSPKVPSHIGRELMDSGNFGQNEAEIITTTRRPNLRHRKKLAMRIFDRELAIENPAQQKINQRLMAQGMIPRSEPDLIIQFKYPVYSGQFSNDGTLFYSACRNFKVQIYDTSNPYDWKYYKTVRHPAGKWTITDASLSPDNKYVAYTSIRTKLCLAPTDPKDIGDPYLLDITSGMDLPLNGSIHTFGIWSIRFSGNGQHLVSGASNGLIILYDIESHIRISEINGHDDDVNAVCLADSASPHIFYSGSDDTYLKVWDTRSLRDNRAAGTFVGHFEGLTYVDSKEDGRYVLSNSKDQTAKLWDIRMVMSPQNYEKIKINRNTKNNNFDYRYGRFDQESWCQDPNDCSLVTYQGHSVLRTLIRCHFSPPGSTNSRYIYSGSEDGMVYIWNLDATLAGTINVYGVTLTNLSSSQFPGIYEALFRVQGIDEWETCVRDASWHPSAPVIVASAWNGTSSRHGTCTVHSWGEGANDDEYESKVGLRVDKKLRKKTLMF